MFSVRQKREIADKVQKILRETNHPELLKGKIKFTLFVQSTDSESWAYIVSYKNKYVDETGKVL